jgi:signal transduction histidine kinase
MEKSRFGALDVGRGVHDRIMGMSLAVSWPMAALRRTAARTAAWRPFARARFRLQRAARHLLAALHARGNRRLTIIVSVSAICACFAAAAALQMQRDYAAALADAEFNARIQAEELAAETGHSLDKLAALGAGYLSAVDEQSAASVLAAESDRVINVALADAGGRFIAALRGSALGAHPLPAAAVAQALRTRTAGAYADPAIGASPLTLIFRADRETPARFVVVLLNPATVMPSLTIGSSALLTPDGEALALSAGWDAPPPAFVLRMREGGSDLRYVDDDKGRRIVALAAVPGWPLAAATSLRAADALASWYRALPLYLFLLLGPAFAGTALAVVLIRQSQNRGRAQTAYLPDPAMTHVKEAELVARLTDAEKRANEAERAKAEFLAHMSHELRTPLNAIVGFAEIIEAGLFGPAGNDKYAEYAGDIAQAARALHTRIGEILELAAIAAERQQLDEVATDAVAVARACVDQVRGFAQARDIKLEARLAELPLARADATAIKRILIVLLSNALRFTHDGGSIHVEARLDGDTIVLAVRDNGYGMSPEDAEHAGTPTALGRAGARGRDRRFGLGFAMAMALARRMGGALRISGALGGGALAELRLPKA